MYANKTIGIVGGMGPEATSELFSRIISKTSATCDQDHIKVSIINDPQIPDRTEYILGQGESPIPRIVENLHKLAKTGADIAMIPCMTAHSFISELQKQSPLPIINAIKLVEDHLTNNPSISRIGLLATKGSYESNVFQKYISKEIVLPNKSNRDKLMNIIYGVDGIKSKGAIPDHLMNIKEIIQEFIDVQAVIAGCTELGLVMREETVGIPVIDPITLLAEFAVESAVGEGVAE